MTKKASKKKTSKKKGATKKGVTKKKASSKAKDQANNGNGDEATTCDEAKQHFDAGPLVVVFGAGIAGLTAAHELVERGFSVHVVEPAQSLDVPGGVEVGGVARTQWLDLIESGSSQRLSPLNASVGLPHHIYFASKEKNAQAAEEAYYPALSFEDLRNGVLPTTPSPNPPTSVKEYTNAQKLSDLKFRVRQLAARQGSGAITIECIGYTDDRGDGETGRTLGLARADETRWELAQLVNKGTLPARPVASKKLTLTSPAVTFVNIAAGASDPVGYNSHLEGRLRNGRVEIRLQAVRVPGDHGYRFFPRFYRNLDDTMRRTPLFRDGEETGESALDQLKSPSVVGIARYGGNGLIEIPRRRVTSMEQMRKLFQDMSAELHYTPRDIAMYQVRNFHFLTSCDARRRGRGGNRKNGTDAAGNRSMEAQSWFEFVTNCSPNDFETGYGRQGDCRPFSEAFRRDLDSLPQAMVGISASESDAHTNGLIGTQMLIDQSTDGTSVDRLLDGPTTDAWLDSWKTYLRHQGVQFCSGRLAGITKNSTGDKLVATLVGPPKIDDPTQNYAKPFPEPIFEDEHEMGDVPTMSTGLDPNNAKYFVLAIPPNVIRSVSPILDDQPPSPLEQIKKFDLGTAYAPDRDGPPEPTLPTDRAVPFRDLSGVQLFFRNDFRLAPGHVYYANTPWALTSISQSQFWREKRTVKSGYLGILSIDLGDMHAIDDSESLYYAALAAAHRDYFAGIGHASSSGQRSRVASAQGALESLEACVRWSDRVASIASTISQGPTVEFETNKARLGNAAGAGELSLAIQSVADTATEIEQFKLKPLAAKLRKRLKNLNALPSSAADLWCDSSSTDPCVDPSDDSLGYAWAETIRSATDALKELLTAVADLVSPNWPQGPFHELDSGSKADASVFLVATKRCLEAAERSLTGKTAWNSTQQEIAEAVWRQIKLSVEPMLSISLPSPLYYHIDENIVFAPAGHSERPGLPVQNRAPYLINDVGGFDRRPDKLPGEGRDAAFYSSSYGQWFVAGGLMKTHTRVTTMEHSNESARHVVRAIVHDRVHRQSDGSPLFPPPAPARGPQPTTPAPVIFAEIEKESLRVALATTGVLMGDLPEYWKPQDHEFDELAFLRRIDALLYEDGLPHIVDILHLDEAARRLVPTGDNDDNGPIDMLGKLIAAARHQVREDAEPLVDAMDRASKPVRDFLEQLARFGVRP